MTSLEFEVVHNAALDPRLRRRILALCSDAYEEDFTPHFELLSDAVHVLARHDGELVGHAAWVARELRAENLQQPLRAAYIEAVATPTALQRRGYGSQVMAALPPLLGDYDIAALSPSEVPFYARAGWELWRGPLSYQHRGARIPTPDEDVMIYRLPKTPASVDPGAGLSTDWRAGDVW